jgi:hypothetical protein
MAITRCAPRSQALRIANRPDRTGAPHRHHVARLDVALLGGLIAGREDVGEEEHLLVRNAVRDLQRIHVGERHPHVLRLAAGVAAVEMRVAVDPGRGEAHQRLVHPGVRIGVVAERVELARAEPAAAAGDRERHDHAVAGAQRLHRRAGLDDLAHEFMSEDVAAHHGRYVAVVEMEIGAADRGERHLHDGVVRIEDLRIGRIDDAHFALAPPADRFHRYFFPLV